MKKLFFIFSLIAIVKISSAQLLMKPAETADANLPNWAKMMYSVNPNVFEVDKAYEEYMETHPGEQNRFTAYYNRWRVYVKPYLQDDGSIKIPTQQERNYSKQHTKNISQSGSTRNSTPWNYVGPEREFAARYSTPDPLQEKSWHANMYCIDRSMSNPNILFAGGECGGVYKTTDQGQHWQYVSRGEDMITVSAIAVNPANENEVLVNSDQKTYKTIDGGTSWTQVGSPSFQSGNISIWQFMYNSANTQMVFAGGDDSLYRSVDGGNNWSGVFEGECQSVAINPGNAAIVYALRYDAQHKIAYFYKSLDSGATFTIKTTGWFTVPAADIGLIESDGGRIAVTEADTSRIYVLLVGESQSTAQLQLHGQIGIYRSDDGGETWSNPHGVIGAPYNITTHPNMMTFSGDNNTYNQIYYNTSLVVSQLNADRILIGGLSMWRSDDSAKTFQPVGGYVGPVTYIHPDNQEFKIYKTSPTSEEFWFSSDGGIDYSPDFGQTHESRANGIYGSAFWGFDQGWNDDIMVGGRYHNGNTARRDGYPAGEFLQLGGAEAATGYVNYSDEKKTYFSDVGGKVLPDSINGITTDFTVSPQPNESYVDNSSSRIMFDWDYWNVTYLGKDNKIFKSNDGGTSSGALHTFGTNPGDKIYWIEQSRANTNVLYVQQVIGSNSVIWKSTDRGISWNLISVPLNKREMNFTLSYNNENELWISYPGGNNGSKVYHSINSGTNWTNITTAMLNDFKVDAIVHQFGTDGGVYLGTYHGPVFYRNNTMNDWSVVGTNLPLISYPLRLVPFYRDNKIRLATWHLGIWENDLYEPSDLVADFSADFKTFYCPGDTIRFVPHCVSSANATYQWIFNGANPSASTSMYPEIVYTSVGSFNVTLIVTDGGVSDTITKQDFIRTVSFGTNPLQEGFETGTIDTLWKKEGTGTGISNWAVSDNAGGFGLSVYSLIYDNWSYDIHGAHDAVWTSKQDFTNFSTGWLRFDVAYSRYGSANSDTLRIRSSTDCGQTFTTIYLKGGQLLSTAPPNNQTPFVPDSLQWRRDSINVTSLHGNPDVIFSFEDIGHYGQILYIDNINLNGVFTVDIPEQNQIEINIFPNPFTDKLNIITGSSEQLEIIIYDVTSRKIIQQKFSKSVSINTERLNGGVYLYEIKNKSVIIKNGKLIKPDR